MKFQILRFPRYLDEIFCPTMIFEDKIDFLKRVQPAYLLDNYGWKFNFVSKHQLLYFGLQLDLYSTLEIPLKDQV